MNRIITIGREFGSGGRELGRRLSEIMEVAYYDQEIITEIAKRTDLSEQYVDQFMDRHPVFSYPIHIGGRFASTTVNPVVEHSQKIYIQQQKILREMAERSDCVIVGRCADHILADFHPVRLFVYADMDSKVKRCREKDPEETRADAELKKAIQTVDKGRAAYYNRVTGLKWGDKQYYDLCVNTSHWAIRNLAERLSGMLY